MKSVELMCRFTYDNMGSFVKKSDVRSFAKRIVKEVRDGLTLAEREDRRAWDNKRANKPFTPVKYQITIRTGRSKMIIKKRRLQYPQPTYKPKSTLSKVFLPQRYSVRMPFAVCVARLRALINVTP